MISSRHILLLDPVLGGAPDAATEARDMGEIGGIEKGEDAVEDEGAQEPAPHVPAQADGRRDAEEERYGERLVPCQPRGKVHPRNPIDERAKQGQHQGTDQYQIFAGSRYSGEIELPPEPGGQTLTGNDDKEAAVQTLYTVLLSVTKMLAPVLPHITEEIWQNLFKNIEKEKSIHVSSWPELKKDTKTSVFEKSGDAAVAVIAAIRQWKQENRLPLNTELKKVVIEKEKQNILKDFLDDIKGTTKANKIEFGSKFSVEA